MSRYNERLEKEAMARKEVASQVREWLAEDEENQKELRGKKFYRTNLDGVPLATAEQEVQSGASVIVTDGYGEVSALTNLFFDAEGSIDGKRLKFTEPMFEETPNNYIVDGKSYFFLVKLSKNQVILADGELYNVVEVDKETREVKVLKKDTIKLKTMYPVYQVGANKKKTPVAYYEKWGDAYGVVLRKRFSGDKNICL